MRVIPIYPNHREANCYILCSGNVCAVIDPGADAERIYNTAKTEGLEIEKILLTHGHFDHIMAVNELCALTGAKVMIHKDDLTELYDASVNLSVFATGIEYSLDKDISVTALSEGDTVSIGDEELRVMSTPGHTPGSCIYICKDIMFVGDTIFAGSIGRIDFPGGNGAEIVNSLKKITKLDGDYTLYSGHGPETTLSREKLNNYYLQPRFLER